MAAHDKATLRTAYLYLVCLVTLIMTIFAAVDVVRNVSRLAYPDPGYYGYEVAEKAGDETGEEELARQEERARESSRRQAVQSIVGSGAMLLVAVPVYLYHWRRVQEDSTSARAGVQPTGA